MNNVSKTMTDKLPQGAETSEYPGCKGSGEVLCTTSHLGPDDYNFSDSCPACNGTGSADVRDAIHALGWWRLKTDIERVVISRSEVIRILDARAALSHPVPAAAAEPVAWCSTREFNHAMQDRMVFAVSPSRDEFYDKPLYAAPLPDPVAQPAQNQGQSVHSVASAEEEAQIDAALGLVTLPPIRVRAEVAEALQRRAAASGLVVQEVVREILASES